MPFSGKIYRGIQDATREERQLIRSKIRVTHSSKVFQEYVEDAVSNTQTYKLAVKKSRVAGNGVFHMGRADIPKGTVIAIYPGSVRVISDQHGRRWNKFSTYSIGIGAYDDGTDNLACKLEVIGAPSDDPYNAAQYNHSCVPNCVLELVDIKGGLSFQIVRTLRAIKPREECRVDYEQDFWRPLSRIPPVRIGFRLVKCKCGQCRVPIGYVEPL